MQKGLEANQSRIDNCEVEILEIKEEIQEVREVAKGQEGKKKQNKDSYKKLNTNIQLLERKIKQCSTGQNIVGTSRNIVYVQLDTGEAKIIKFWVKLRDSLINL